MYEIVDQPVRDRRLTSRPGCGRRTSTRSTKCPIRAGSRTGSARRPITVAEIERGANAGAPPDPSRWVLIREKTAGMHPGFTAQRRQGRDLVPRVRSAGVSGGRDGVGRHRDEDLLGAWLQPGRVLHHDVRSEARGDRSRRPRFGARPARGRPSRRTTSTSILERVARKPGRHLSRHRRPADSGQDPGQLPATPARGPTIPTTSCRTSTAASCARCACSARGRTSPISRRRTRSTRS